MPVEDAHAALCAIAALLPRPSGHSRPLPRQHDSQLALPTACSARRPAHAAFTPHQPFQDTRNTGPWEPLPVASTSAGSHSCWGRGQCRRPGGQHCVSWLWSQWRLAVGGGLQAAVDSHRGAAVRRKAARGTSKSSSATMQVARSAHRIDGCLCRVRRRPGIVPPLVLVPPVVLRGSRLVWLAAHHSIKRPTCSQRTAPSSRLRAQPPALLLALTVALCVLHDLRACTCTWAQEPLQKHLTTCLATPCATPRRCLQLWTPFLHSACLGRLGSPPLGCCGLRRHGAAALGALSSRLQPCCSPWCCLRSHSLQSAGHKGVHDGSVWSSPSLPCRWAVWDPPCLCEDAPPHSSLVHATLAPVLRPLEPRLMRPALSHHRCLRAGPPGLPVLLQQRPMEAQQMGRGAVQRACPSQCLLPFSRLA